MIGFLVAMMLAPLTSHAESTGAVTGLKPETRESVRQVGQSLLRAKRAYVPDQDVAALRVSVDQVRRLVSVLTEPLKATTLQLETVSTAAPTTTASVAGQPVSQLAAWRQARAAEISQLRSATANLRSQCQAIRDQRQSAASKASPSLLDSVVTFFTGAQTDTEGADASIVTPVTAAALTRLEQVETDIEDALDLPAAERQQRLSTLAETLSLDGRRLRTDEDEKIASPTLSSRTQHRRAW